VAHRGNVGGLGAHLAAKAGSSVRYAAGCARLPVDKASRRAFSFYLKGKNREFLNLHFA